VSSIGLGGAGVNARGGTAGLGSPALHKPTSRR